MTVKIKEADQATEKYWSSRKYKKWGVRLVVKCQRLGQVTDVKYVRAQTAEGAGLVAKSMSLKPADVDYVQLASPAELGATGGSIYA